MKMKKALEILKKNIPYLTFKPGFECEDFIEFTSNINAKDLYDDILLTGEIYSTGAIHVYLKFDTMSPSYENFVLLNDFNANNPWFKAYIEPDQDGVPFLTLACDVVASHNEKHCAQIIENILGEIVFERTKNMIKILIEDADTDVELSVK